MAEDKLRDSLKGKNIPIVILDNEWHQIFQIIKPSKKINLLKEQLEELLKKQGKANTETKDIKKLKKKLMGEIVQLMDSTNGNEPDKKTSKKLEDNKRLIAECNEKVETYQDNLLDLPEQIRQVNEELMLETMELCYYEISTNSKNIAEITSWITSMRIELKKQILRKQDREVRNRKLYHYLHGIFGAEVIDLFDLKYDQEE